MQILLNYIPDELTSYFQSFPNLNDQQKREIEGGYAVSLSTNEQLESSVLIFKDVEDHVDGNGLSMLWVTQGQGIFYYQDYAIPMNKGDAIIFDDNSEHGFQADELCYAVNFKVEKYLNPSQALQKISEFIRVHTLKIKKPRI